MNIRGESARIRLALNLACALVLGSLRITFAADETSARWEPEIRQFEAADKTNPPPSQAVLFIGSSSIRFWTNIESAFPAHQVFRRGFGGSELSDSVAFADRILVPYHPRLVLLYAGDNDIANGKSPEQVFEEFKAFVRKVHTTLPNTVIGYIAIKPSLAREKLLSQMKQANDLIGNYVRRNGRKLVFVDVFTPMLTRAGLPRPELFAPDGLHVNEQGYKLWAAVIAPVLDRFDRAPKTQAR